MTLKNAVPDIAQRLRGARAVQDIDDRDDPVTALNRDHALVLLGDKAMIIREVTEAGDTDRMRRTINFIRPGAFRQYYANKTIRFGKRQVSIADAWLEHPDRRSYPDGIVFAPQGCPPGTFNLWNGPVIKPERGDCGLFLDHLRANICHGDESLFRWVFGWFAQMFQRPWEKPGTALVLRGKQGTGKTLVGKIFGSLIPDHYYLVDNPRYLTGQFNSHMMACLLLQADEGFWAGDKQAEGRLKSLITGEEHLIEKKGVDAFKVPNYLRLLITSNEGWVVPAGADERRFTVLDVGDYAKQNREYFKGIKDQLDRGGLQALLWEMMHFDLSSVDVGKVYRTGALDEQALNSLPPIHQWWFDCLRSGSITPTGGQWDREVMCALVYESYVRASDRVGIRRKSGETQLGSELRKLVPYVRRRRIVQADGTRPYAYEFPDLDQCREAFSRHYGMRITWDEGSQH
ncbi:DUF5906 domain-containing protein [Tistrella mobilis]|uniref:primase-helicase family protein n=1 Tax=Tistrella mobilis TaxID=171437 RepID=UPI003556817C